jgi:hypothetical protein
LSLLMNVTAWPTGTVTDFGLTPAEVIVIGRRAAARAAVAHDHGDAAARELRGAAAAAGSQAKRTRDEESAMWS